MFNTMKAILMIVVFGSAFYARGGDVSKNLVRNCGFEGGDEKRSLSHWICPPYWSGKLISTTDKNEVFSGRRALKMVAKQKKAAFFCRTSYLPLRVMPGFRYRISLRVKGTGTFTIGRIDYPNKCSGKPYCTVVWNDKRIK